MPQKIQLVLNNPATIVQDLVRQLYPYRDRRERPVIFIAEGTIERPIIGLRYPGKKVKPRDNPRARIKWENLFDFEVVPFKNGKEIDTADFTFEKIFRDFKENKKDDIAFWRLVEEVYHNNDFSGEPPRLRGIDPKLYLLALKWIWIQEDLNYKLNWRDVVSPEPYCLRNKKGNPTAKGAGRAKFFAALILLKRDDFSYEEVKKIIPAYS